MLVFLCHVRLVRRMLFDVAVKKGWGNWRLLDAVIAVSEAEVPKGQAITEWWETTKPGKISYSKEKYEFT